jgi:DNA polymerase sigma
MNLSESFRVYGDCFNIDERELKQTMGLRSFLEDPSESARGRFSPAFFFSLSLPPRIENRDVTEYELRRGRVKLTFRTADRSLTEPRSLLFVHDSRADYL